jgi:hypothetical protein
MILLSATYANILIASGMLVPVYLDALPVVHEQNSCFNFSIDSEGLAS